MLSIDLRSWEHFAPLELRVIRFLRDYKHPAPPELMHFFGPLMLPR